MNAYRSRTLLTSALVAAAFFAAPQPRARGQVAGVARQVVEEAAEQIFRQAGRDGLEQLAVIGGRTAVREVLEQSSREGGEQLVRRVTQYGLDEGPAALRAIGRSPAKIVGALDALKPAVRPAALRALERDPGLLGGLVSRFGGGALEVAAEHPGVGEKLVQTLGSDGVTLGRTLGTDDAILAARHAGDIATLPAPQRAGVVAAIARSPAKVLEFLETHPRTLRTAAGVALVCGFEKDIVGDRGATTVLPDGRVVTTPPHPGLIERVLPVAVATAHRPLEALAAAGIAGAVAWIGLHLLAKWRTDRVRLAVVRASITRDAR